MIVAYHKHGDAIAPFLPDSLNDGAAKTLIAVLLAVHTIVAYVVCLQPLHRVFHENAFPQSSQATGGARVALGWAAVVAGQLCFGFVFANAVPFFGDLQSLIGAMTGAPIVFGWPPLLYLLACRARGTPASACDRIVCVALFLCVLLPLFSVLGTITSVQSIVDDWGNQTGPFTCDVAA